MPEVSLSMYDYEDTISSLHSGFQDIVALPLPFDVELLPVLCALSSYADQLERRFTRHESRKEQTETDFMAASIRYRLLRRPSTPDIVHFPETIADACRIGGLLFTRVALYEFYPRPYTVYLNKLQRYFLDEPKTPVIPGKDSSTCLAGQRLCIWLSILACMLATEDLTKDFFLDHLAWNAGYLQLDSWDQVKAVLERFAWVGCLLDDAGLRIWQEAVEKRSSILREFPSLGP